MGCATTFVIQLSKKKIKFPLITLYNFLIFWSVWRYSGEISNAWTICLLLLLSLASLSSVLSQVYLFCHLLFVDFSYTFYTFNKLQGAHLDFQPDWFRNSTCNWNAVKNYAQEIIIIIYCVNLVFMQVSSIF